MKSKKDNSILVEFDFLIDLDMAIFKLIQEKYNNPEYVDQSLMRIRNEKEIIKLMLARKHINPLELIIPDVDTTNMYYDFMGNKIEELLKYAKAYDTFGLMVTLMNNASSLDITILCENKQQENFIKSLNPNFKIIVKNRQEVIVNDYTALYVKYLANIILYQNIAGKYIYVANAGFNMDEEHQHLNLDIAMLVADVNIIKTIDLYKTIKY